MVFGPDSVHGKMQQWFFSSLEMAMAFAEQSAKDQDVRYTVAKRIGIMKPVAVYPVVQFIPEEDLEGIQAVS